MSQNRSRATKAGKTTMPLIHSRTKKSRKAASGRREHRTARSMILQPPAIMSGAKRALTGVACPTHGKSKDVIFM